METEEDLRLIQVSKALREALINPTKNQVKRLLSWCLENFVTQGNLQYAIENDLDILTLALNHYGLGHSSITPSLRTVLKLYWDEVEPLLTDASKIYSIIISKRPECKKILDTPKGRNYLNRCCQETYNKLYEFTWKNGETPLV